ncbi:MAG: hypothetical protein HYU69_08925 [Bacteroidetes bacterium]|nr:hypothetical protein [Bacteroidota bacterium]
MGLLKYIQIITLAGLPVLCVAQDNGTGRVNKPVSTAADCPSWNTRKQNDRGDFLEYMRKTQGKKTETNNPYLAYAKMLSKTDVSANNTGQRAAAKNDFYARKRYNLFPNKSEQNKTETIKKYNDIPEGSTTAEPTQQTDPEKKEIVPANNTPEQVLMPEQKIIETVNGPAVSPTPEQKEQVVKNKENGSTKVESNKTRSHWFKKKATRLFSKKTNKPARPNYEKCTTRF